VLRLAGAITDVIPQLEDLLNGAFDRADKLITDAIIESQCSINADGKDASDTAAPILWKIVFGPLVKIREITTNDYFTEIKKQELKTLSYKTAPVNFRIAYDNISQAAAITACRFKPNPSREPEQHARKDSSSYASLSSLWFRLEDSCAIASDCLEKVERDTKRLIKKFDDDDPTDTKETNVKGRMADYLNKAKPIPKPKFFGSFDPKSYEQQLFTLLAIQDSDPVAHATRLMADALDKNRIAKKDLDDVLRVIQFLRNAGPDPNNPPVDVQARLTDALKETGIVCHDIKDAYQIYGPIERISDASLRAELARRGAEYASHYVGIRDLSAKNPQLTYQGPDAIGSCSQFQDF
jgi:hypothetical protein